MQRLEVEEEASQRISEGKAAQVQGMTVAKALWEKEASRRARKLNVGKENKRESRKR